MTMMSLNLNFKQFQALEKSQNKKVRISKRLCNIKRGKRTLT